MTPKEIRESNLRELARFREESAAIELPALKPQGRRARWLYRLVSWLDAKVDRAVEIGVDDFERKCDAAARTFSTIAFTFCAVVVIVAVALKWALAS